MICTTIIPTIGRSTLQRAVQSALDQGFPPSDHEIVIVNDSGAPLNLSSWLSGHGVRVVSTNRCGLNTASNVGAAIAKGHYLKFLHDDDYLLPGGLQVLVNRAESTDAIWIVGGTKVVDDGGIELRSIVKPGLSGNIYALFLAGEVVHMGDCLISRKAFMEVGGFDPQIKISEDRDLGCRLSLIGDVASAEGLVACIRIAGSSGSTFDFHNIVTYSRIVRERGFDAKDALPRLKDSVRGRDHLRGRVCRGYIYSAVLNVIDGKLWLAGSRLTCGLRLANWHLLQPKFWQGFFYRKPKQLQNPGS